MGEISAKKYAIAALLDADAEITGWNVKVYPARYMPLEYERELAVFFVGGVPHRSKVLGAAASGPIYQYGIQFIVKYKDDDYIAMEDLCLDIENAVYRILGTEFYDHPGVWKKITFPAFSVKPIGAVGTQNVHIGRLAVRVLV